MMETSIPRVADPRFLFLVAADFTEVGDSDALMLDYRYLRAADLPGLILENIGVEAINYPHAIDTIEDNAAKIDKMKIVINKCEFVKNNMKFNDILGTIQVISYVMLRLGKTITFYLKTESPGAIS